MKIKHILLCVTIGLVAIGVITMGDSFAQQGPPPDIKMYLALKDIMDSRLPGQAVYLLADPDRSVARERIKIVLTFINKGENIITSKGFSASPFHLYLTFTDPDGNAIIANKLKVVLKEDAPPPETIEVNGEPVQVDPVETLLGGGQRWTLSITIPDAHAFYTLSKAGRYSVNAVIPMRTYSNIDYPGPIPYSKLDDPPNSPKWSGALYSNTEYFTLVADKDHDGYSYPVGISPPYNALPDCNDNDPNEHPGQTWYKDADNDGYGDAHATPITQCTRPAGYKLVSELIATNTDCDDNDLNRNPGKTEIPCNGIDDDCNPLTPDVPAPVLASPANGAMNVSTTPTLSWNAVSCAASSYGIQVATNQSFSPPSSVVIDQSLTGTSFTVSTTSPLSNNTTYYWRVNAKNAGEVSDWSLPRSFTTIVAAPSAPTLVSPANGATGVSTTPTLSWNASSRATSYGLQVSTSQTDWTGSNLKVNQSGIANTSQAVSGLANGTLYYWRVNATNAGGTSAWSSVWSFTTIVAAPSAPTLVSPANGATGVSTTPTLSWNASSRATSYGLQVSTSQTDWTGSNLKVNQSGIAGTSQAVSGLANGTLYYWRVNATNAGGTSAWSSVWSFTTTKQTYLLTVTKAGMGSGDVTVSPGALSWNGNVGTASYDSNTTVTLTATPNAGSTFTGWSASCSGTGNCSVVIIGSKCTLKMCGPCKATATFTAAPPTKAVRPVFECVVKHSETSYTAYFGYQNDNTVAVTIPVGPNNKFTPNPQDRGQTTVFQPGRVQNAFSVVFNGNDLVWYLKGPDGQGRTSTASRNSARCK